MNTNHQQPTQIIDSTEPEEQNIPGWFVLLFGMLLIFLSCVETNAQVISFNNGIPTELMVCEKAESFTVEFTNTSANDLSSLQIQIVFPTGIEYVAGSLVDNSAFNIQETNLSNLSSISFSANNLTSGGTISYTFEAMANYDAYTGQLNGDIFSNQVIVNYAGGSETVITDAYNLLYPALSVTQVSPMSTTVFVGGSFTQAVTVVNGGYGSLSSFVLKNTYDSNLTLEMVDIGILNNEKNEITFSAADFVNIGNGDGRFDQNESIVITQTMTATGCNNAQNELTAFWGCDGQNNSSNTKFPFTTVQLFSPDLVFVPTSNFGTCVDQSGDNQQLAITNNGTGPANASQIEILPYTYNQYTRTAPESISYTLNGNVFPLLPVATQEATGYECLGNNPIDGFTVALPTIQPGETLYLNWKNYTCATTSCGKVHYVGWQYEGQYTDMCESRDYEFSGVGQENNVKNMSTFFESPSDLVDGQIGTYTLNINAATFDLPTGTTPYFEAVFDIPVGLVWSGVASDLEFVNSQNNWPADQLSYDATTRKLVARYDLPIPANFSLNHSSFNLNLTADCAPNVSWVTVGMQVFHIMDTNCTDPYRMAMTCRETPETQLHCPGPCEHGMVFKGFDIARISLGKSDNDLDGLPDATNNLNMTLIKSRRMMTSDTFETTFTGEIKTSATFPSWNHGYATSNIPFGNDINILSARVSIFDKSTGQTISCDQVPFSESVSGGVRTVNFDFSPGILAGLSCNGFSNFKLENEDKVQLTATYKMTGNIGGNAEQAMITNDFFVSNTPNGSAYQCNDWNGNFTAVGYFYTTWKSEQYNVKTCTETIYQNYYMSIGDCCTNYSGGNMFPFEFRNWSNLESVRIEIPAGYSFVEGSIKQWRTKNTNSSVLETSNITPTSINGTTHIFDMAAYYAKNGGTLNLSDDGYNGQLAIEIKPECTVNEAANLPVDYYFSFRENNILGGQIKEYTGQTDFLKYYKATVTPYSTLPTQDGIAATVIWDLTIKNQRAPAANGWFHLEDPGGNIIVQEVKNTQDQSILLPINGFYQLGDLAEGENQNFQITAAYNSCELSTLKVISGADCDGYPTDPNNQVCETKELTLALAPQPSELQVRFDSAINPSDECDNSITIEVEMLSSKLAAVEDLFVNIAPSNSQTVTIESGSMEVLYPASASYFPISEPALQNNIYTITGAAMDPAIGEEGLIGVTDVTANKVRLRFNLLLGIDYKPGEIVNFEIGGQRPCGNSLPTIALAYDPNASFGKPENIGLEAISDAWAAAWGDYDNDGNVDLFVTNYAADTPNILYHNNGNSTFTKVTTGVIATDLASSLAATWGDYDNDGDLDLYVGNNIGSENFLYRNNGGTFTRIMNDPAVTDKGYAHGVSWVDYDNDGHLDIFVSDYFSTSFNQLYHNNGDGTFEKANGPSPTLEANFSVSSSWGDYNSDGLIDLFVCNTAGNNNSLYKNTGNGNFLKINTGAIVNDGANSVGASWGDYDNDGDLDLFVANAGEQNNFLYQNNGDESFLKISTGIIVNDGGHSHGSAWGDYDNDGDLDLFVSNDQNQSNFLYSNDGNGNFTAVTNDITQDEGQSFGAAWADYDNDGDIDLFVANHQLNENFIYQNARGKCQNKVCVTLEGTNSNRSAIGTKIRVKANIYGKDVWQMREVSSQTGGGIGGQNELKIIIGLGDATVIDSMIVAWNSGYRQIITNKIPEDCFAIIEDQGSKVCGAVYFDENKNCTQDTNEIGIPNMKVVLQPGNLTAVTDSNGIYSFLAAPGAYSITQVTEETQWNPACTPTVNVTVAGIGGTFCGNNFADTAACSLPDLQVDISATAHRVGFENLIALTYKNTGTRTSTNTNLAVKFGNHIIPLESSIPWTRIEGTNTIWELGDIPIGASVTIFVKDSVSVNAAIGDDIHLEAAIQGTESDCDMSNNIVIDSQPAVGAIDPNDIAVTPEGYIQNNQELIYKIRFQNVGNVTVSTVRIEDQLPEGLDVNSLQLGLASHNYQFEIQEDNRLVWTFENINMPDSLANEAASHGFVIFKIKPKTDLEDGKTLQNSAAIFFDNIAPITTNTVVNIIGQEPIPTYAGDQLHIFPNPMTEQSSIQIVPPGGVNVNIVSLEIFDLLGKKLFEKSGITESVFQLNKGSFPFGHFIVKVVGENGQWYSGKILIQ